MFKNISTRWFIILLLLLFVSYRLWPSYNFLSLSEDDKELMKKNDFSSYEKLSKNSINLGLDLQGGMHVVLEGLSQLLNTIRLIQKHKKKTIKEDLEIEGILITMFDNRLNLSKQVVDEVKDYFDDKVYNTFIQRNVRLGEAPSHGKPILLYDATSTGAQNYMNLASEILKINA